MNRNISLTEGVQNSQDDKISENISEENMSHSIHQTKPINFQQRDSLTKEGNNNENFISHQFMGNNIYPQQISGIPISYNMNNLNMIGNKNNLNKFQNFNNMNAMGNINYMNNMNNLPKFP